MLLVFLIKVSCVLPCVFLNSVPRVPGEDGCTRSAYGRVWEEFSDLFFVLQLHRTFDQLSNLLIQGSVICAKSFGYNLSIER